MNSTADDRICNLICDVLGIDGYALNDEQVKACAQELARRGYKT